MSYRSDGQSAAVKGTKVRASMQSIAECGRSARVKPRFTRQRGRVAIQAAIFLLAGDGRVRAADRVWDGAAPTTTGARP